MTRRHFALIFSLSLFGACPDDGDTPSDVDTHADGSEVTPDGDTSEPVDTIVDSGSDTTTPDTNDIGDTSDGELPDAGPFTWPWPLEPVEVAPHVSWKSRIVFPEEPYAALATSYDPPSPRWIKFTVLTADPTRVFFQNSQSLPFHYDFGVAHLPPLAGLSHEDYDRATLYHQGKKAILGAVLFAPYIHGSGPVQNEIGIQLASVDPLDPRVVTTVLALVRDAIDADAELATFYMPTFEQEPVARVSADHFAAEGFPLGSAARWSFGDICYVEGWSIGRLVEVAPDAIEAAWQSGALGPDDILVTTQVPAEVPPVAGIVSRAPSTPASHVALLAETFEIPFVFAATEDSRALLDRHLGERVALRATTRHFMGTSACRLELDDIDAIEPSDLEALQAMRAPPPLELPRRQSPGRLHREVVDLERADIVSYGGKSANFGTLRRAIPEASPDPAIAFSFDLFDRLMQRPAPEAAGAPGLTLGQVIEARLAAHDWPPEMQALATDLAAVRDWVRATSFAETDRQAVLAALAPFEPARKIRFRSSTNVEDSATFTGAGLYDSYSGCLLDDTDGDALGPSRCDAAEPEERGVLRAIGKVMASFWNDNAFLARLRHRVPPADVAMGVLVHESYPDPEELANGVALTRAVGTSRHHRLTTQLGALSVTNPEGHAQPEVVTADVYSFGTFFYDVQGSSLVPLGAHVMTFEDDYRALTTLLDRVTDAWLTTEPSGVEVLLDFEYKRVLRPTWDAPRIEVKQVRPLPPVDRVSEVTSFLLPRAEALELCTFQGETGSLFGNHRGKVELALTHRPTFLDERARTDGFLTAIALTMAGDVYIGGPPANLPGAFAIAPERGPYDWSPRVDGFTLGIGESAKDIAIETRLPWVVTRAEVPLVSMDNGMHAITIEYAAPQYDPDYWDGELVRSDYVQLGACPHDTIITPAHPVRHHQAQVGAVSVDIRFWYPPQPTGVVAGYTAWLARWDRTILSGFTSRPIELRGYWSQTFRPGHHNFEEGFLFEPALEVDEEMRAELELRDIRLVHVRVGYGEPYIKVIGADGRPRDPAQP